MTLILNELPNRGNILIEEMFVACGQILDPEKIPLPKPEKNERNVQQRRLGLFLCRVPDRVGAPWDDDAGVLRQEQRSIHGDGVLCP